jgi:hypothetical protein
MGALSAGYSPARTDRKELRLVHYGSLYGMRINFAQIFQQLARSGRWDKITLCQYGPDWDGVLESISDIIAVDCRPPLSWAQILAEAPTFHAAIVIGWHDSARMPSKTVQYLTLPIPRIAMVNSGNADALARYVADKPGWVAVRDQDPSAAQIVAAHLSKRWSQIELSAPERESWDAVEHVLGSFVVDTLATPPRQESNASRAALTP